MAEFEPITSQDQLNAVIGNRLQRERESLAKQYEGFDGFKEKAEAYDKDIAERNAKISDLTAQLAERDGQIEAFKISSTKRTAAEKYGIPSAFADRISGTTEKEIMTDAEGMSKFFKAQQPSYPTRSHTEQADVAKDGYADLARRLVQKG